MLENARLHAQESARPLAFCPHLTMGLAFSGCFFSLPTGREPPCQENGMHILEYLPMNENSFVIDQT